MDSLVPFRTFTVALLLNLSCANAKSFSSGSIDITEGKFCDKNSVVSPK